jgi:hypothetical protein
MGDLLAFEVVVFCKEQETWQSHGEGDVMPEAPSKRLALSSRDCLPIRADSYRNPKGQPHSQHSQRKPNFADRRNIFIFDNPLHRRTIPSRYVRPPLSPASQLVWECNHPVVFLRFRNFPRGRSRRAG